MKEDARELPASAQEEKRKRAVKLWKKQHPYTEIGEILSVNPITVSHWIKRYQAGGMAALKARKRGREQGSGRP